MTSIQVLTEFASVCTRKLDMSMAMIDIALQTIARRYCFVCDLSLDLLSRALSVRERYGYSYYDSIVIASAVKYRCRYLFTEDMRDGQLIDGVEIVNIFGGRARGRFYFIYAIKQRWGGSGRMSTAIGAAAPN